MAYTVISYSPALVLTSLVISILACWTALELSCRVHAQRDRGSKAFWLGSGALAMGLGIWAMHYVGMAAIHMQPMREGMDVAPSGYASVFQVSRLGAAALTGVAGLCLCGFLLFARLNRRTLATKRNLEQTTNERDQLSEYQQRLVKAYTQNGVGAWEWTAATNTYSIDDETRRIFDCNEDLVLRSDFLKVVHPDDLPLLTQRWSEALLAGNNYENEYRIVRRTGETRWCRSVATITRNAEGAVVSVLGMSRDMTAEHARKISDAEQARRFYVTLEAIGDGVLAIDAAQHILYANPVACELTGWPVEMCIGRSLKEVFVVKDELTGQIRQSPVLRCIDEGGRLLSEGGILVSRTGASYNIRKYVNVTDEQGSAVITFQDMTAACLLKRELEVAANHDNLTGLPNRAAFLKRLRGVWETERQDGRTHCLCLLDLDRFKLVNDTAGHLAGDMLLQGVVSVLRPLLREGDYLARMSGDEFLLLLCDTDQKEANALATTLLQAVEAFRFVWEQRVYSVTASMGIVFFDGDSTSLEALTSHADVALYTCKRNGRNRIAAYEASIGEAAGNLLEMETASDIRAALDEDRFELYAQPIVPLRGANAGDYYEILVRMRDQRGNLVPPGQFIPAAECFGIMQWIDQWVMRRALLAHAEYVRAGSTIRFAINLSADSLSDPNLWEFVREQFRATGVSPETVTFEVTESGLIRNLKIATSFLEHAQAAGCRIALDDFGTGMSSLSYLKHFPPDVIKIDGSFVRKLLQTPLDQSIVKAISQIAHSMHSSTVAECAEDMETVGLLAELGVDYVQGWATGKPEPLLPLLAARARSLEAVESGKPCVCHVPESMPTSQTAFAAA